MLFDLEDYRSAGIIGPDNKPANQINWVYPYTTFRQTRDAYLKAVNEYFLASQVMCTPEEAQIMNVKYVAFLESNLVLGPLSKEFWQAMVSLPIAGQLTVGDRFNVSEVDKYAEHSSYIVYPGVYPNQPNWVENYKSVAKSDADGEYVFTEMTQQLYDDYKEAFADFQSKVKEIITISEGIESFDDYVAPAVPAWNSYPELSGYVRGINNLTIKNAVVRLIDADGANHDLVTDDNGYYKFDKEMFYNNIAFDHTDDMSNFKMFLLENVSGSTASLYDKTSIYQNSFWGAENNREVNWEISIKMGKPARKNFKIEVIENYSDYPSIKGHVKDQDGNAVKGALVALFYMDGEQWLDADYNKNTDSWRRNTKISLFGEDKSLLTDENGYYEYPSQFVGEWFNKNFLVSNPEWSHKINEDLFNTVNGYSINNEFSKYNDGESKGFDTYSSEWVYAIAEQADGKFLVGGNLRYSYEGINVNKLIRLNTDGTLDTTFTPQFSRSNGDAWVSSIEVQADGKILVGGGFDSINDVTIHNIARLNSDGTLDETFAESVFSPIYDVDNINYLTYYNLENPMGASYYPEMYVNTIKSQADGKILVGGYFYIPQINSYGIVRFNSDGSLDDTFMNYLNLLPSKDALIASIADEKSKEVIYLTKESEKDALNPEYDRLNNLIQPALDYLSTLTEGTEEYTVALADYESKVTDLDSFKENVLYPAKQASESAANDLANARSTKGQAISDYYTPLSNSNFFGQRFGGLGEEPRVIKLQSDGKILIGGSEWMNFGGRSRTIIDGSIFMVNVSEGHGIIRLNSDGTLDNTFSIGLALSNSGNYSNSYIKDILVQSDGKIIVAGYFSHFGELTTIVNKSIRNLIRLNSDGTLDTTFDTTSPSDSTIFNIFESGDGFFISGEFGMRSYKSNGDSSSSYLDANGTVQRAFKTSDDSILVFGSFNTVWDEIGTNYSVQGMVKLNVGEMRFVNESKKTFDYNPSFISYNEGTLENKNVRLNTNDFKVVLLPYIQDQINGIVTTPDDVNYQNTPVADRIYDYSDWFNSKFSYAWNERNEVYVNTIEIGENVIDIQEVIVDPEVGAEKVYISMEKREGWDAILFGSTTGYIRLVDELGNKYWPSNGSWFDFNGYVEIGDSRDYYAYSCNSLGGAEGKITTINLSGNVDINIDELTGLQYFNTNENSKLTTLNLTSAKDTLTDINLSNSYYLQSVNISGCNLLNNLYVHYCKRLKSITGLQNLNSLTNLTINYSPVSTNGQAIEGEFMYEIEESSRAKDFSSKSRVDGEVRGIAELPDGSSVYVGTFNWAYYRDPSNNQDLGYYAQKIVKFKADGTIDENFMNNIGNGFNGTPNGIELLSDGKLIIYGDFDYFKNKETGAIIKLSSTGVLDTSFITKIKDKVLSVRGLLFLEDGSMLIISDSYQGTTTTGWDYRGIYKLKANGDLDTDFKMYLNNTPMRIKKLGDSFFVVGYFDNVNTPNSNVNGARIAKFDINGNIDSVFMNNTLGCRPYSQAVVYDIEMDSSGNIIICGDFDSLQKSNGNVISMATRLARYDSTGLFDQNLYDSLCVNGNPISLNGGLYTISIQGDKTVIYGGFNQINNVDQGQKRYLTIDSNGLNKVYVSEFGSLDGSLWKIIKKENYTYLIGNWWTYFGFNGIQYDTTPMAVKLVKTPKVISTLVVPSTTQRLYLRLDRLYANLDTSNASLSNAYIIGSPASSLDFSNSPNISYIEVNECRYLTNLVIGNPSNLQGLYISGCPSVDISTIDLGLVKGQLNLNYVDLGTNDLVIDAPYIRNINLTRVKANSVSIIAPILNNQIAIDNCTFNNVSINAPQTNNFYQRGNLPGLNYSSLSGIQTLNLNEMSSLPDLSVFTNLRNLFISRLQWSSIIINSNTLIYLDITSWNNVNQNISINAPELTYAKFYGFYQKPNFESIITPKLFTLSLDWCNQLIQSLTFEQFSMIKRLEIQNYMELRELDLSALTSLQQLQINWVNRLNSLTMPSGATNGIREFRIQYSPWTQDVTTAQRTAIIGNSLEGLAKSTWNGGYANFYSDRTWQLDATAISNKTTLRNNKGWNISGNLSN
jgi:uncharacterized delta-60 repeat protein